MSDKYDCIKLENQLCFPLYAVSKEIIRRYKPFLDELDLTYTQYITMMALWEGAPMSVKELGERLYLDTGTLTPLLKAMEKKGLVSRARSTEDERCVLITLTAAGESLRDQAVKVPAQIGPCIRLKPERARELYTLLYELIGNIAEP